MSTFFKRKGYPQGRRGRGRAAGPGPHQHAWAAPARLDRTSTECHMRIGGGGWSLKVSRGCFEGRSNKDQAGLSVYSALCCNRPAHKRSPAQETRESEATRHPRYSPSPTTPTAPPHPRSWAPHTHLRRELSSTRWWRGGLRARRAERGSSATEQRQRGATERRELGGRAARQSGARCRCRPP